MTSTKGDILVVDDEDLMRWFLRERLEEAGFGVDTASCAQEALATFADGDGPSFVLLDYRLPDLDGLTLMRRIRACSPASRVALMTAFGTPDVRAEALGLGACCIFEKPFDVADVVRAIRNGPPGPAGCAGGGNDDATTRCPGR